MSVICQPLVLGSSLRFSYFLLFNNETNNRCPGIHVRCRTGSWCSGGIAKWFGFAIVVGLLARLLKQSFVLWLILEFVLRALLVVLNVMAF